MSNQTSERKIIWEPMDGEVKHKVGYFEGSTVAQICKFEFRKGEEYYIITISKKISLKEKECTVEAKTRCGNEKDEDVEKIAEELFFRL